MWITLALWIGCSGQQENTVVDEIIDKSTPAARLEGSNVLFIVMDTLRADRLGSYGYSIDLSPNLDKLAEAGVRFENHIVNCSWTRPSMGTIFTGHYPRTLGLYEEQFDKLSEEFTTIAERFKAKGYQTYGVTSNPNTNSLFGFAQGFDEYGDAGIVFKWMKPTEDEHGELKESDHSKLETATTITDRTIALIDHNNLSKATKPFFLTVTYIDPHDPYHAPEKYNKFSKENNSRTVGYDAGVRYADEEIGRLLTEMNSRGLMENTTIIFTSDHGEGLKSHPKIPDSHKHGTTLYDSNVHVPLFIHHPKLTPTVISQLNSSIDLVPTWIDIFGLEEDSSLPGVSLAPWIFGSGTVNHPEVVFIETEMKKNDKIAVRTPTHSFILNEDVILYREDGIHEGYKLKVWEKKMLEQYPLEEMYDRSNPFQYELYTKNNIISSDVETATKLRKTLQDWNSQTPVRDPENRSPKDVLTLQNGKKVFPFKNKKNNVEIDDKTRKALEQLGYLDSE